MKQYAGIGSRETPDNILSLMKRVAGRLQEIGYCLLSGGAKGADSAFASGCTNKIIFLPWKGFEGQAGIVGVSEESLKMAQQFHPAWDRLSQGAQKLQARNCHQILGQDLKSPVDFVLCWTPDGAETSTSYSTGGTGQAIRIAIANNVPVFNMRNTDALERLKLYLQQLNKI